MRAARPSVRVGRWRASATASVDGWPLLPRRQQRGNTEPGVSVNPSTLRLRRLGRGLRLRGLVRRRGVQVFRPLGVQTPDSQDPTTELKGPSASRTCGVRTRSRRRSCRLARSSGCPTTAISTVPSSSASASTRPPPENGRRCSAAVAYLKPARKRRNLTVRVNVTVSKVVIKNGRAVGVQAIEGGVVRTYSARREVIVASGAFGSPKLLQLSGIGDPATLLPPASTLSMRCRASGRTCRTTWTWTSSTNSPTTTAWTGSIACARRRSWPDSSTWPSARDRSRPTWSRPAASATPTRTRRPRTCSSTSCPRRGRSRA